LWHPFLFICLFQGKLGQAQSYFLLVFWVGIICFAPVGGEGDWK